MESRNRAELKFASYHQVLLNLFTVDTADIEFQFPKEATNQIRAHKKFLAAISPVFQAMFAGNWLEKDVVKIEDIEFDVFNDFISVLYGGKIEIDPNNIFDLLNLVKKYQIDQLVPNLTQFMEQHLNVENAAEYMYIAIKYDLEKLRDDCNKFISECTEEVVRSDAFIRCDANTLRAILELDAVSCSEADIFDGCIEWAKYKCRENGIDENDQNVREQLGDCFTLIRFKEMENCEFVKRCGELFSKEQLCELIVHFYEKKTTDHKRHQRPPPYWNSANHEDMFSFNFPLAELRKIGHEAAFSIKFKVSERMKLVQLKFGKCFVKTSMGCLNPVAPNISYILLKDRDIINAAENLKSSYNTINLHNANLIIEHGVYELYVVVHVVHIGFIGAYAFDHMIESQAIHDVDLIIKKDSSSRTDGPLLIKGLCFKKISE